MIRVHCTPEDLLRVTVADRPAPLMEVGLTLAMAQRRDAHPVFRPWRRHVARALPRQARPLLQLVSPMGLSPRFLDPPGLGIEEGVDRILSTPGAYVRTELERVSSIDRPRTLWMRHLADRDRDAWQILEQAVRATHTSVIAKVWPRLQAGFHAETAWRSRLLAQQGLHAAVTSLAPGIRWHGMTLEAAAPFDAEHTLHGGGIVLLPSLVWADHVLAAPQPDGRLLMIYPAVTPLPLHGDAPPDDPLAALVGQTRSHTLRLLQQQRTTTDLARALEVSPAAASMQAKTLREAGLIVSRRDGKAMWHWCTPLGLDLLAHAST